MIIEHIGMAVDSLDDAVATYRELLGVEPSEYDEVDEQGVRVAMIRIGESRIELLEPTRPDSPVARFLERRGPGVHHLAIRVDDIDESLERMRAAGARLVDKSPRRGAGNTRIAFVHPASMHGVLLELVEHGE